MMSSTSNSKECRGKRHNNKQKQPRNPCVCCFCQDVLKSGFETTAQLVKYLVYKMRTCCQIPNTMSKKGGWGERKKEKEKTAGMHAMSAMKKSRQGNSSSLLASQSSSSCELQVQWETLSQKLRWGRVEEDRLLTSDLRRHLHCTDIFIHMGMHTHIQKYKD